MYLQAVKGQSCEHKMPHVAFALSDFSSEALATYATSHSLSDLYSAQPNTMGLTLGLGAGETRMCLRVSKCESASYTSLAEDDLPLGLSPKVPGVVFLDSKPLAWCRRPYVAFTVALCYE